MGASKKNGKMVQFSRSSLFKILFLSAILISAILFASHQKNRYLQDLSPLSELSGSLLSSFSLSNEDAIITGMDNAGAILRIRQIKATPQEAQVYAEDRIASLFMSYEDTVSPYPGDVSNSIHCEEEFKPKKLNYEGAEYYSYFVSSRLGYGVCSEDLIKYNALLLFLHCNSTTLYQVEAFVPKEKEMHPYLSGLGSLYCKGSSQ